MGFYYGIDIYFMIWITSTSTADTYLIPGQRLLLRRLSLNLFVYGKGTYNSVPYLVGADGTISLVDLGCVKLKLRAFLYGTSRDKA